MRFNRSTQKQVKQAGQKTGKSGIKIACGVT